MQIKRNFIEEKIIIAQSTLKLERNKVENIITSCINQNNETYSNMQLMKNSLIEIDKELSNLNSLITSKISLGIKKTEKIDLSSAIRPIIKFTNNSIRLYEKQSENRTFHEFCISNDMNYDLKDLKLFIVQSDKCLSNFNLEKNEEKKIKIMHEYDLLMQYGKLDCYIIFCSAIMSNKIEIGLLEIKLEERNSKNIIVIQNRFTTQDICYIYINNMKYKSGFKIIHFDTKEIELDNILPENSIIYVCDGANRIISNTLNRIE